MIRTISLRALTRSAILALGAPHTAFAAPANTGGAAEATDFVTSAPMAVTRGSINVAENADRGAQSTAIR